MLLQLLQDINSKLDAIAAVERRLERIERTLGLQADIAQEGEEKSAYLTKAQASSKYKITTYMIDKLRREGKVKSTKVGKNTLIEEETLKTALAESFEYNLNI